MNCTLSQKWGSILTVIVIMGIVLSCSKDEYDFKNIDETMQFQHSFAGPIIRGSFTITDFVDEEDSLLQFDDNSISMVLEMDSLFSFNVNSFNRVLPQDTVAFSIVSPGFIPGVGPPPDTLAPIDTVQKYAIDLGNDMRIDTIIPSSGALYMHIQSTFQHAGVLRVDIPSISVNGVPFDTLVQISSTSGDFETTITKPLSNNTKIIIDNSEPSNGFIQINYEFTIFNSGNDINAGDFIKIDYALTDFDSFDAVIGYFGDSTITSDTIISPELEILDNLSGTFAVTNPKLTLNYEHSFGIPIEFDLQLKGIFGPNDTVTLIPGSRDMDYATDYRDPYAEGSFVIDRDHMDPASDNLDDFFVFPTPEQIGYNVEITPNPEGETVIPNFMLQDSEIQLGLEFEVPLEFRADLTLIDTLPFEISDEDTIDYIEYINLYYTFENQFPLGFNAYLVMYDSINVRTFEDTIKLNATGGDFILPAPVDSETGETLVEQVTPTTGYIAITEELADTLFTRVTHLILVAEISTTGYPDIPSVKILSDYSLDYKFSVEARTDYLLDPDEE